MVGTSHSQSSQVRSPVAFLDVRHAAYEYDKRDSDLKVRIPVYANDEFYLGRNSPELECAHHQTVSKRQLKFHCVLFEAGTAPLVYAENVSTNGTYLKRNQTPDEDQPDSRGILMLSKVRTTLLGENDELWVAPDRFLQYRIQDESKGKEVQFPPEVKADMKVIRRRFLVQQRSIGEGACGAVLVAIHRKTQRQLACKMVDLQILRTQTASSRTEEILTAEFDILKNLDHPNIIKLEKVFHSHTTLYIFQELLTGGDLFSFINKSSFGIPAIEAAVIVRQILAGVDYLHDHGIIHRDLKPDNVLLTSTKAGSRIVITDFGQARYLPSVNLSESPENNISRRMLTLVGTAGFTAPEVHKQNPTIPPEKGYSAAVDMWSIGCITSHLLSGSPIFTTEGDEAIRKLSSECNLDILERDPVWQRVGRRAKDFIKRTLVLDEDKRITVKEALKHEWFSNPAHADELEAVYQHAIKNWEPRRKIFKLIEFVDSPRPQMTLNRSHFWPDRKTSAVIDMVSGQLPVMETITEERICTSPLRASSHAIGDEYSEIPGPPQSYDDTVPEDSTLQCLNPTADATQQIVTQMQLHEQQQDLISTQDSGSADHEQQELTPTQLLSQENHTQQYSQILYGGGRPASLVPDSYMTGLGNTDEESMHQEMTQLSLTEQHASGSMSYSSGTTQQPYDIDQEMTESSPSDQEGYSASTSFGKRQPSFDFDQGMEDSDFLEVAAMAEYRQPAAKKLRTG